MPLDFHRTITERIVLALEADPGSWQRPWSRNGVTLRPANVESRRPYQGINVVALWAEAQICGYASNLWGTYRQWRARGGQVRKGVKAATVVFYGTVLPEDEDRPEDKSQHRRRRIGRAFPVFNADQVDGLPPPTHESHVASATIPAADWFVAKVGADIAHGCQHPRYLIKADQIEMPDRTAFTGSATSTRAEAYYSTLFHELVHWTGATYRCSRQLMSRFGSDSYAMEELVAELGAAFLCADLGVASVPRPDHAQYLAHWLRVLKADNRAIFSAASKATEAVTFLVGRTKL